MLLLERMKKKTLIDRLFIYLLIAVIIVVCLFPMLRIFVNTIGKIISGYNALRIQAPTMANCKRLVAMIPLWINLCNSLFSIIIGMVRRYCFLRWPILPLPNIAF